jgi:hypothetical protein
VPIAVKTTVFLTIEFHARLASTPLSMMSEKHGWKSTVGERVFFEPDIVMAYAAWVARLCAQTAEDYAAADVRRKDMTLRP